MKTLAISTLDERGLVRAVDAADDAAADITREDWLAQRRTGLGGSDAPVVCGVSKYKSPLTLWAELRGEVESDFDECEATHWGHVLEPAIAEEFERRSKRRVHRWPQTISVHHPDVMWQRCTPDAMQWCRQRNSAGVVQIKTTAAHLAHEWIEDDYEPGKLLEFPESHRVQITHEMNVVGATWGTIVVLIGGQKMLWCDVEYDFELGTAITAAEELFWRRVQTGEQPAIDGSESTAATLKKLHPKDSGATVMLGAEFVEIDREFVDIKERLSALELRKKHLETMLRGHIGEATFGVVPGGVTYSLKAQTRKPYVVEEATFRVLRRKAA